MDVNTVVAVCLGGICALSVGGVVIISAMGHESPPVLAVAIGSCLTGLAAIWNNRGTTVGGGPTPPGASGGS